MRIGIRTRVQCAGLPVCSGLLAPLANVLCGWAKSGSARSGLVRALFVGMDANAFAVEIARLVGGSLKASLGRQISDTWYSLSILGTRAQ